MNENQQARSNFAVRNIATFIAFASFFICSQCSAAQVRAWLDRSNMQMGETVTLNIEVTDDASASQPDFAPLQQDFNVLGTQSSTSMTSINLQTTTKLLWAVGLEPKRVGTLTIPALRVAGSVTQPLALVVQPASAATGKVGDDVFLDVEVEPHNPYVQQQLRMTVKLLYAVPLTDGNLEEPHGDGLLARKLGQDAQYSADIEGRRYNVLERHYALAAQKSGAVTIEPIVFRGHSINQADINSFLNRGHAVSASASATTLDVRARPANSGNDAWLPAQSLTLSADGVDAASKARVGEPLTLSLHLKAQGLSFEQLPQLTLPKIDGADVYPDKEITQNRDDATWQSGERERKFAIVPNRPGTLQLPPLSIAWWDVAHDRAATSEVPGVSLQVSPAVGQTSVPNDTNSQNVPNAALPATKLEDMHAPSTAMSTGAADAHFWRVIAIAAVVVWLLTLVGIALALWRRRALPLINRSESLVVEAGDTRAARKQFFDSCERGDLNVAARSLLVWAQTLEHPARNLGALAAEIADATQRNALHALARAQYGEGDIAAADLRAAFRNGPIFVAMKKSQRDSVLPALYPFSTS